MTKSEIRLLAVAIITVVVCAINFWVWTVPRIHDYYEDTSNLDDSAEVIPSDTLQKDQGKIPDCPFDKVEHRDGTVSLRLHLNKDSHQRQDTIKPEDMPIVGRHKGEMFAGIQFHMGRPIGWTGYILMDSSGTWYKVLYHDKVVAESLLPGNLVVYDSVALEKAKESMKENRRLILLKGRDSL